MGSFLASVVGDKAYSGVEALVSEEGGYLDRYRYGIVIRELPYRDPIYPILLEVVVLGP